MDTKLTEWNGFSPNRFKHSPVEKAYAEKWVEHNHNYRMLEYLLSPTNDREKTTMTDRDMYVANKVIQWLGSSCGSAFIRSVVEECQDEEE